MSGTEFCELGMKGTELTFKCTGSVRYPLLLLEQNGEVRAVYLCWANLDNEADLHQTVLNTLEALIRRSKSPELFVGYEGFVLKQDSGLAVRVLVAAYYSDTEERFWVAQTHEGGVGEWRETPSDPLLCGFEGLWARAKAYQNN